MILGVNVDHVATVREARKGIEPDPLIAAELAIKGGADGITVHLREDRRHIQDHDLIALRKKIKDVEINLEMAATHEMIEIALEVRPDMVTLVPERRAELTTEGGLDLKKNMKKIQRAINRIQAKGIPVSLFINPDPEAIEISSRIDAKRIEIHTGMYANAKGRERLSELKKVRDAVKKALKLGLEVNAGHGLNYENVTKIASIKGIRGLYIGHSIVSNSIYFGMEEAVRKMKTLIEEAQKSAR